MPMILLMLAACLSDGDTFGPSRAHAPADELVFNNGTEPEYLDPGLATGHPDGRIIGELFDGLTEYDPKDLSPRPSLAERWDAHPDGRGYTFHLRPEARWTDGTPITAHDVVWSWERVLNPIYLSRYAQQLYAVENAERYNQGRAQVLTRPAGDLAPGTGVELVESNVVRTSGPVLDEPGGSPVGLEAGLVVETTGARDGGFDVRWRSGCPDLGDQPTLWTCQGADRTGWIAAEHAEPAFPLVSERVVVDPVVLEDDDGRPVDTLAPGDTVVVIERADHRSRVFFSVRDRFGWLPDEALAHPRKDIVRYGVRPLDDPEAPIVDVPVGDLLTSPSVLGVRAVDDHTLQVRLGGVAPYFLQQTSHTTLRPAPRQAIEAHGPRWTRPENIVTSGPFLLAEHRVRDKIVLEKNPDWWGADTVRLNRVVAYAIENLTTSANLYRAGRTDLIAANDLPAEFIPILDGKDDFRTSPALSTYFYRLNTTEPPLDDARVRRALSMAIDRDAIVKVTKAGQIPANHVVPPGIPGYEPAEGPDFDPDAARALLADAGYPGGEGFPPITVLYNTQESHKLIAAVIQEQWRKHLGIDVQLTNREWKTYLKAVDAGDFDVARAGWIGDYLDPNTFLDLWVTDGGNNNTGWSNAEYDRLIAEAAREPDPDARAALLHDAEAILAQEMPFIPIYWYTWVELLQPDVRGYHPNLIDQHPLRYVWLER